MGHWVSNVLRVIRWYYVYMGACYVDFWKRQLHDSNVLFLWYTIRKILSYMIPLYAMSTLNKCGCTEISVQFSLSVVSNSLQPHELQHARPPCPSPSPGVHSDSHPSSRWCHPAISSSVVPFSSCPQSLPASESFPKSQLFVWGGQSTGVSALTSFVPKKPQGWSPSELLVGSPCSPRDSQESSPTPQFKSLNSLVLSLLYSPTFTSIHDYWKNHSLD